MRNIDHILQTEDAIIVLTAQRAHDLHQNEAPLDEAPAGERQRIFLKPSVYPVSPDEIDSYFLKPERKLRASGVIKRTDQGRKLCLAAVNFCQDLRPAAAEDLELMQKRQQVPDLGHCDAGRISRFRKAGRIPRFSDRGKRCNAKHCKPLVKRQGTILKSGYSCITAFDQLLQQCFLFFRDLFAVCGIFHSFIDDFSAI